MIELGLPRWLPKAALNAVSIQDMDGYPPSMQFFDILLRVFCPFVALPTEAIERPEVLAELGSLLAIGGAPLFFHALLLYGYAFFRFAPLPYLDGQASICFGEAPDQIRQRPTPMDSIILAYA